MSYPGSPIETPDAWIERNPYDEQHAPDEGVYDQFPNQSSDTGDESPNESTETDGARQLTCERCGNKTDGGAWLGFVYVGAECITNEDREYIE